MVVSAGKRDLTPFVQRKPGGGFTNARLTKQPIQQACKIALHAPAKELELPPARFPQYFFQKGYRPRTCRGSAWHPLFLRKYERISLRFSPTQALQKR